ncbi:hypothetical protein SAY87_006171 [Trapa incisa]|uniref:Vacuolar ATPase assembly integral membrane protein VMA21 homolog n=1 Tax=Trapa incisa TaxID=236973 RepID=A0AAN7K403_9MYRT|nr:hypothetical protein SAY87_006171 [Trapa incisa]
MAEKASETSKKNPKKANLLDQNSIKHVLDESVSEIVTGRGYVEDVRMSNVRLVVGSVIIAIALFAQFYKKKFPENREFLIGCITLYPSPSSYIVFNVILQLLTYTKEKNAIMFTYPPTGSFTSTGLIVSSKLPRCSDLYTLTIASADPKSISANKTVELTKSVTKWFTKDGVLVEGLFWKDVEGLINDYNKEPKKSKTIIIILQTRSFYPALNMTGLHHLELAMSGVVSKFFIASLFMWIAPIAILYGFNHNLFPGLTDLSPYSLTLLSGFLAVLSVNVVIGFYIYLAMKEPSEKHEPDPKFLAEAQASVKKPLDDATDGPSHHRLKEE